MNQTTLSKMKQMKFYGMHGALTTAIETGKTDHYTLDQFIAQLIEAEWDDRLKSKNCQKLLKTHDLDIKLQ